MPHVTKALNNEVGVQIDDIQDLTGQDGGYRLPGLIIGQFRRGRFDKPMLITSENVRALLGHDSGNVHYRTVLDVLDKGVQSIQVLRVPTIEKIFADFTAPFDLQAHYENGELFVTWSANGDIEQFFHYISEDPFDPQTSEISGVSDGGTFELVLPGIELARTYYIVIAAQAYGLTKYSDSIQISI